MDIGYHYPITGNVNTDTDQDGLPDAWELYWFGNLSHSGSDLDANGNTLLSDYQNGTDPNVITFTIQVANNYVNTSYPSLQLNVTAGIPYFYTVLVDSTNFTGANWSAYSGTSVTAMLGSRQGWHEIWVGLRGLPSDATQTWQWKRLKVDFTPPQLTLTSPTNSTVNVPLIQVAGFCPEPLDSISYDLTNALGLVTNQDAGITSQYYDNNTCDFTTNYFECVDVPLTSGLNLITFHATDLAGNATTTNFSFAVDYSGATNPVVRLTWPTNGMELCGSSFTLRGWVDDPTATVVATITDTNGNTSTVSGEVERTGVLWAENLPLAEGTNWLTLSVTNAAGYLSVTNFSVVKSDMTLALTSIYGDLWQPTVNVSGVISPWSGYCVWVNGVKGTNNGDGTWNAGNVPVSAGGVASFDISASSDGGDPYNNTNWDKPARWYQKTYDEHMHSEINPNIPASDTYPFYYTVNGLYDETLHWMNGQSGCDGIIWNETDTDRDPFDPYVKADSETENFNWPATGVPETRSYTNVETTAYSSYTNGPSTNTFSGTDDPPVFSAGNFYNEHCDVKAAFMYGDLGGIKSCLAEVYPWSFVPMGAYWKVAPYTRTAHTTWELQTGGKALSRQQNLFCLSATAAEQPSKLGWGNWNYGIMPQTSIPAQNITIDVKPLGNDGNQWRTYPDNVTRDITPRVKNQDFYTFNVTPQKYELKIQVNDAVTLDPDEVVDGATNFWVGQYMSFGAGFEPALSEAPEVTANLWVFDGKYVNDSVQPYTTGSVDYFWNYDPLTTPSTHAWWVYGTSPSTALSQLRARFAEGLDFANGQHVSVTAKGLFNMLRPQVTLDHQTTGNIRGDDNYFWKTGTWLHFGGYLDSNLSYIPGVSFQYNLNASPFGASQFSIIQTGTAHREFSLGVGINYIDSAGLDTKSSENPYTDPPAMGILPFLETNISVNDSYVTYLMFQYDSSSIPIPLESVGWSWGASASANNSWQAVSPQYPSFIVSQSPDFPKWTNRLDVNTTTLYRP